MFTPNPYEIERTGILTFGIGNPGGKSTDSPNPGTASPIEYASARFGILTFGIGNPGGKSTPGMSGKLHALTHR